MNKPKVAVIGLKGLPAFGGAATVGENIIEQLKGQYSFTVYSVSSHTDKRGEYNGFRQVVFRKFPVKKLNILVYYLSSMLHCLFVERYDLIHLHHIDGAVILPFLRLKYKVVCTIHARPQLNEKWPGYVKFFFRVNERILLGVATEVTSVALPLAEIYRSEGRRAIHYIPNGISLTQQIANNPVACENYLLFAAGRIIPLKGLHILLKALKEMPYDGNLLVIGDLNQIPVYRNEILTLAKGLQVTFIDIIKEKPVLLNYVKKARLFIFPSYSEAMSMMLLEAAYCQTPVVCSDIPENRAVFSDNEAQFFKVNDVTDLKDNLVYALTHQKEMNEKSVNAFEKLKTEYNWATIAKTYDAMFRGIIGKNK